mmetsp:Transcript_21572/g.57609  ORF Transcript_21572/g.57609 Transcript_21572/m.57609 type:complete len:137 (-) Transcript_21572:635-1045(-)
MAEPQPPVDERTVRAFSLPAPSAARRPAAKPPPKKHRHVDTDTDSADSAAAATPAPSDDSAASDSDAAPRPAAAKEGQDVNKKVWIAGVTPVEVPVLRIKKEVRPDLRGRVIRALLLRPTPTPASDLYRTSLVQGS